MTPDEILKASFATDGPACDAPSGLDPFPFQRGGVAYAREALGRHESCIIGDDMGLGKTIQGLCLTNGMGVPDVTILCPASLRINWAREAAKWLRRAVPTIIGYEQLVQLGKTFEPPKPCSLLIVDEAQYLKTPSAKRTLEALAIKSELRCFLSGTPLVNRPVELWPVLNAIDPGAWGTLHEFGERYCGARQEWVYFKARGVPCKKLEWKYDGAANLKELQYRLRSTIMVRRLKKDVLKDLPPKVRQIIVLPKEYKDASGDLLPQLRKVWKARSQSLNEDSVGSLAGAKLDVFDKIAKVRHEQALAKVPSVSAHIQDVLASVEKVIVFAHHRDVIAALAGSLAAYQPVVVQGGMSDISKQACVDDFQTKSHVRVFIGQIEAAGVGITLTAAHTVIFAELGWTPGGMSQCEDRAHRIGQKGSVLIQHIVLDGSIDALISKILIRKQKILDATLDGTAPDISFDWLESLATVDPGDRE